MTVYKTQNPSADNPRSRPWYKHNFPLVYVVSSSTVYKPGAQQEKREMSWKTVSNDDDTQTQSI